MPGVKSPSFTVATFTRSAKGPHDETSKTSIWSGRRNFASMGIFFKMDLDEDYPDKDTLKMSKTYNRCVGLFYLAAFAMMISMLMFY